MKLLWSFCLVLAASLMAHAQDEAELVKKVKAKLDKVNDYTAKGRMTVDVSFIDAKPSDVTVYFKKPNKFKVNKEGGISILPKGGVSVNMNTLLINPDYEVVPGKDAVVNGTKTKVVKLLPTTENADVILTTLYIDEANLVIRKATVSTRENGTYDIELSYGKYISWGLADKVVFIFNTKDFKVPKGITFEYDKGASKEEKPKSKTGRVEILYKSYTINKGVDDKVFAN